MNEWLLGDKECIHFPFFFFSDMDMGVDSLTLT